MGILPVKRVMEVLRTAKEAEDFRQQYQQFASAEQVSKASNKMADDVSSGIDTVTLVVCVTSAVFVIFTVVLVACIVRLKRRRTKRKQSHSKYGKIFTTLRRPSPFSVVNAQRQLTNNNGIQRASYNALDLVTDRPQMNDIELTSCQSSDINRKLTTDRLTKYHSFESAEDSRERPVHLKSLKKSKSLANLSDTVVETEPSVQIAFSLKYVKKLRQLRLKLHDVSDLPAKTYGFDVMATVYLFPRNTGGVNSRSVKGGKCAQFEETFVFDDMTIQEVEKSTLRLVLSYKRKVKTSKENFLGEMFMKCNEVDWSSDQPMAFDSVLLKTKIKNGSTAEKYLFEDLGSLFVCIEYQSSASRLKVMVRKAGNLPKSDKLIGRPGHYVIINLLKENNEVVTAKETRTQSGFYPTWNQPFLFDINGNDVNDYTLDFVVMRGKLHTKDAVVGHVTIGKNVCKSGRTHWKDIMSPRPVESAKWHPICPVFNFKSSNTSE